MSTSITIAGIRFDIETARTLELVGGDNAESVQDDLAAVRAGYSAALLAHCLDGAEGRSTIEGWRDYVSTLCAEADIPGAFAIGDRVESVAEGDDADAGRVLAISGGDRYTIGWDSGVRTDVDADEIVRAS